MHDWIIIGGGLHGRHIANALQRAAPDAAVCVLDRRAALVNWRRRAEACGMSFLRSSIAHHVGAFGGGLRSFAAGHGFDATHTLGVYRRPSRALFETHAVAQTSRTPIIDAYGVGVERAGAGWRVVLDNGEYLRSRHVVLALGPNQAYRPTGLSAAEHVYDPDFALGNGPPQRLAVIGGGISGAQLALRARALAHRVTWITRTRPRIADFDSDPCYAGPKCLVPFANTPMAGRGALLAAARRPGTLPPDVHARITAELAAGTIEWRAGEPVGLRDDAVVFDNGARLPADRIILATGFETRPTTESLLTRVIKSVGRRIDADGHVVLDESLAAAPGLHITGRPASLLLGPMAGNIKGARLAAGRLATRAIREDGGRG